MERVRLQPLESEALSQLLHSSQADVVLVHTRKGKKRFVVRDCQGNALAVFKPKALIRALKELYERTPTTDVHDLLG